MADYSNLYSGAAVVIGGSGGLGAEICQSFSRAGSHVAIAYNSNVSKAKQVAEKVTETGKKAFIGPVDLTNLISIKSFLDSVMDNFKSINTLVYASGPPVSFAPIADQDPEQFKSVIEQDVIGYFNLLHEAIPHLRNSKGSIVALSTGGTRRYVPKDILSIAPKGSVEQLTRGVAREEGRNGIRANIIGTGWIDAGQGKSVLEDTKVSGLYEKFIKGLPLQRCGEADEVADAVLYLASNSASYITGNFIDVDGGGNT